MDFVKNIEFNDIKTKTETKEGIVKIKKEKIESPEFKQSLDFVKKIEFEGDFKPKLEFMRKRPTLQRSKFKLKRNSKLK
jgi:hypothetical protein